LLEFRGLAKEPLRSGENQINRFLIDAVALDGNDSEIASGVAEPLGNQRFFRGQVGD